MSTKKRTTFLTIWLVLISIGVFFGFMSGLFNITVANTPSESLPQALIPDWYLYASLVALAVQVIAVVMMWMWKKLGVYTYFGTGFAGFAMALGLGSYMAFVTIVLGLMGLAITYLAIKPNWKQFE